MHGTQQAETAHQTISQLNVAEFILQRLKAWQVKRVYGYLGDGMGIFEALLLLYLPSKLFLLIRSATYSI